MDAGSKACWRDNFLIFYDGSAIAQQPLSHCSAKVFKTTAQQPLSNCSAKGFKTIACQSLANSLPIACQFLHQKVGVPTMGFKIYLSPPHMCGKELEYVKECFDTNWIAPYGPQLKNMTLVSLKVLGTIKMFARS